MKARPAHLAPLFAATLGLAALISCTGSEAAAPESAAPAPEQAYTATIDDARPIPEAPPPNRQAVQNTRFSYSGELTQGGFIRGVVPDGTVRATLGERVLDLADDGSFFAAFDRDSDDSLTLSATVASGQVVREDLTIAPRAWQIERVNVARRPGRNLEAYWKVREPEYNAINAARAKATGAVGWKQQFIWPVKGRISGRFGRQRIYAGEPGSYHSGIDIAPGDGEPFVAPADGVVVLARTGFSLEGGLIIIDHGMGLNSAFLHASKVAVEEGQTVRQGQYIGNVGATGRATGPHLHWGLKWNDTRLDPLLFVGPMN
ncbi:M23 family metallopeptidase [Erythrobacter sp. JK5]|uniref:M23 family metallopeptidase n=1 Tax=Erythrobacter sp. JK5 TaxID=2829500 RepID=UPI001BA72106|nr:M23 family metallopeptidase [Erythrobacter sp. JK5]QUL37221.1 M23 family metallopeptidase [Erythrobacter sp. JK5]